MPYIVKSSLGVEPTILPWNEVEKEKLIKEKQQFLKEDKNATEKVVEKETKKVKQEDVFAKNNDFKKTKKVGEK